MTETIDLAAEFNRQIAKIPGVAGRTFASIPVNVGEVALAMAQAWADDMRENLQKGLRPDGKGKMPKRKTDGQPRGYGTDTVASIAVKWGTAKNRLVICAQEDDPGTLARILRGIPLKPPATSARQDAVQGNAALIAMMKASAAGVRGRTWSAKRLADWRKWQALKKEKAAASVG